MSKTFPPDILALFGASDEICLFVWEVAEDWPVRACTSNVQALLGYSKEDFESGAVKFQQVLHPDDAERVSNEILSQLSDISTRSVTHEDYRLITRSGDVIWVADTTLIERHANGQVSQLVGYMQHISARKHLELALLAERRHLQMVLEGTRLGSWDWHPQSGVLTVNSRWLSMYGYDVEPVELSMRFWESLIHPDDRHEWHQAIQAHLFASVPFYEHVYRMRHARGHYVHTLDRGKVVEWDDNQSPVRMTGTHTDISKQKQAELEAREAVRTRTVFLANMSHEIRTPLHGILGLASVLANTELSAEQRELLHTMQESGAHLLNTLNDAIDISRADQGKLEIKTASHETAALTRHLRSLFVDQARRRGIDFQVAADGSLPTFIEIDKSRFLQIAVNLINNAFKFTKIGYIRVGLSWQQQQLVLQVSDSGVGIEDTERVWHVFEQESEGSLYPKPGGGLGLGIVRSLVQLMGGYATVKSQVGQGSVFKISLPAAAGHAPAPSNHHPIRLPIYRILVIDDNDVNQLILGEMLSKMDQVYVATSSAHMGLQVLQQQDFDVVFMDVHMPEFDGIEATRLIRQQSLHQPFIIGLTANAMPSMRDKGLQAGMNAFLTKPFQLKDIQMALREVEALSIRKNI